MRDRLQKFIGATAYDVGIYTFHSFCNLIIRENPEEFGLFGNFDLASDLDLNNIATDITKSFQKTIHFIIIKIIMLTPSTIF